MLKIFILNSHIAELFLIFAILIQLLYGSTIIRKLSNAKYLPTFISNVSSQSKSIVFILLIIYFSQFYISYHTPDLLFSTGGILISKVIISLIAFIILIFLERGLKIQKINFYEYYVIFLIAVLALLIMLDANDLLTFYLVMEAQALCFYVLAGVNRYDIYSTEASLKYFIASAFISAFYLMGTVLIYGCTGSINLDDLALILSTDGLELKTSIIILGVFLIVATLLLKLGVFPFHFWMVDVYDGAPLVSTMVFSTLPKYSIVFFFIKLLDSLGTIFEFIQGPLVFCGLMSALIGTCYALVQERTKRMMLYSSVVQVGFISVGLAVHDKIGISAVLFFVLIYILTSLLIWGHFIMLVDRCEEISKTTDRTSGLFSTGLYNASFSHYLGQGSDWHFMYLIIFFSISGIPPFLGFISKLVILDSLLSNLYYVSAMLILIVSAVSVFYYIRVVKVSFFEPRKSIQELVGVYTNSFVFSEKSPRGEYFVIWFLTATLVFCFFFPNKFLVLCDYIALYSYLV
jgi:NADH-quinone oxidoreductase subunit N